MASVFEREGRWYVKLKGPDGKWRRQVTTAQTKTEARRLAAEIELKTERTAERQRLGLEARPTDTTMTLTELCRWWLDHRCPEPSRYNEGARLDKHVFQRPIGALPLPQVTTERLEDLLNEMEKEGAAPASLNKLRTILRTVFERGRRAKHWTGPNPVSDVETRRVVKKAYQTLRAEEVAVLLAHVDEAWRNLFAAALWTGLRKGELCGLLKTDVDLPNLTLLVARSYDRDTTKGGVAAAIPIAEPLVPYLQDAIARSQSQWVFPAADGSMRTEDSDPQNVLRTALARAGLVEGYEHVCRRCKSQGKPHSQRHPDPALRRCEACGMKLWPKAIQSKMRFHDLRHSTATLLLRAKVDPHRVQRILRHADIRTTLGTYGHLDVEDLREAVNVITPSPVLVVPPEPESVVAGPFGPNLVQGPADAKEKAAGQLANRLDSLPNSSGRTRFRTWDPCRVNPLEGVPNESQTVTSPRNPSKSSSVVVQGFQAVTPVSKQFGPNLVQGRARLRGVSGGSDRLLTVREVAERLQVSKATVYRLCEAGELDHVRVSNAVRVAPEALARYLERAP